MAKTNVSLNNNNYSIDESTLSEATAALASHLSTVMNGSGATINLGGTSYSVDFAKLSAATNSFASHLGTIAGESGGSDTLTWDGTAKDGIIVDPDDEPMSYMSDVVLTENDLCNGYTIGVKNDDGVVFEETHSDCESFGNVIVFGMMFSILEDNTSFEGMAFPKKGLYISSSIAEMIGEGNVFFLTIPGYTGFGGGSGGSKVTVNGVEYSIDPTKLAGAVAELETVLGGLNSGDAGGDTLTWDGNTEGRTVVDMGGYPLVHVSDAVVTAQDVANGYIMEIVPNGVREFPSDFAQEIADNVLMLNDETFLICCSADNCEVSAIGLVFPKRGVYFMGGEYSIKSLTIPGYTGF